MCGITGILSTNPSNVSKDLITRFAKKILHRGPDDIGLYLEDNIAIANTRLSILDIEGGNQPFFSDDGNIVVVQNGEIYNFIEVRDFLEKNFGEIFKTNCDTEVILSAYKVFGLDFIHKLNGMFAISILDKTKGRLYLFRDRMGVKPLYYYLRDDIFMFSSEIKSFYEHPRFEKVLNFQAIHNYFVFNYFPVPETIIKNVFHVHPGNFLEFDLNKFSLKELKYWRIPNTPEDLNVSEGNLVDELNELIQDAVRIRLRSDVDIGAFLSGGLDSSLVCAMAAKDFNTSLETFSIGFKEKKFDESPYAKEVADLYGLKNNVHYMQHNDVKLWSKTTYYNDQPHGDISFIPTYVLSKFASKKFKVVFTGDGGDEVFGGYTKYFDLLRYNPESHDYFDTISLFKEKNDLISRLYSERFKSLVDCSSAFTLYKDFLEMFTEKDHVNKGLLFDVAHLLPGNNLVKPDKMAMANSLETRSPLLDYRLFERMYSIPGRFKVNQEKETKYIMKKLALRYLPESIVYRDKQMFTVPIGEWFRTHLKEYLLSIVESKDLIEIGLFDESTLRQMAVEHISGKKNYTRELRAVANLDIWLKQTKRDI